MACAASFGLAGALSVVVLGDESGYVATEHQKMKIAAMEAMWETEPAPAGLTVFAIPGKDGNRFEVKIPWVLGLITTRSLDTEVPGIRPLVALAETRIRNGMTSAADLDAVRADPGDGQAREAFAENWRDLGYGLLLKRYRDDIQNATPEEVHRAALDTVPDVRTLFWSFRIMVALGLYMIAFFAVAWLLASLHRLGRNRTLLKVALFSMPAPWIAIEAGWIVAEYGRQPWAIEGVLPTFYAASGLSVTDLAISLCFFVTLYTALACVMVFLMLKTIKAGPRTYALVEGGGALPQMLDASAA
jgi:cytochrome bd ubiquinol oxidase subunit I